LIAEKLLTSAVLGAVKALTPKAERETTAKAARVDAQNFMLV